MYPSKFNCQTVNCQISEITNSLKSKKTMKYDIRECAASPDANHQRVTFSCFFSSKRP